MWHSNTGNSAARVSLLAHDGYVVLGFWPRAPHLGTLLPICCCRCWPLEALADRRCPLLPCRLAELDRPVANVLPLHLLHGLWAHILTRNISSRPDC